MCGFAGEFILGPSPRRADPARAARMAAALAHRGPDEEGAFLSADGRCAIAFRRLAVIDPAGSRQPMSTADGNLSVACNGEIYNYRDLRRELAAGGAAFRTAGDVEVLLELYRKSGQAMLNRLAGMFAFALYDQPSGCLLLARDRMGEKPLYYAVLGGRLVFASEIKALLLDQEVGRELDRTSINLYMSMGYIPAPATAYKAVRRLGPGCLLEADTDITTRRWWRPEIHTPPAGRAEIIRQLRTAATRAVEQCMVSDVPLGALLSGGLDSSIIVALMASIAGGENVRTFTAGFDDPRFDERPFARRLAAHCGTRHVELAIPPASAADMLERITDVYDDPFGDSSALPMLLICQAAREHVTVALTGDGGDEVFCGYDRYRAIQLASRIGSGKYLLARLMAALIRPWAGHDERSKAARFLRFADNLPYPLAEQYFTYRRLFGPRDLPRLLCPDFAQTVDMEQPASWFTELYEGPDVEDEATRAQLCDLETYLPDDLLIKTDMAAMACSLEVRCPLLSHELVNLGISLPLDLKIGGRLGKVALREAFGDLVPPPLRRRAKQGFGVPLDRWLRSDLLETMRQTLFDPAFLQAGIVQADALAGLVNDHLSGKGDHRHRLWALLVLAKWFVKHRPAV